MVRLARKWAPESASTSMAHCLGGFLYLPSTGQAARHLSQVHWTHRAASAFTSSLV